MNGQYMNLETLNVVLAVNDTTQIDFSAHPATQDLGYLQNQQQRGLLLHTTLAVAPQQVHLGL
jgi:hypothetical protein